MAEKQTFTYYLNIEVEAMNEESAMKKLEAWVEPTLALKKNSDLELTSVEYDESEEEEDTPTQEKTSLVRAAMKKGRPELKVPEKDDFDYDNIPDWEELEEEAAPKKAKSIILEDPDELDGLLDGLEDDPEEATGESEDEDEDWDWDNENEW